jgi:hypothetical protein
MPQLPKGRPLGEADTLVGAVRVGKAACPRFVRPPKGGAIERETSKVKI